jgi:mannose-6-phosphate isomerase-like protein (cupin superfamily)
MGLHENVHEMCYVLSGRVQLRVGDSAYDLEPDDTVLFDGLLDHAYHQLQAGEFVTVHVPKDIRAFQRLLGVDSERPTQDLNG